MPPHRSGADPAPDTPEPARQIDDTAVGGTQEGTAPDGATGSSSRDLRSSAIDGVKWNFVATLASLGARLLFTFVLARLIGPENFGIVALATLYITFSVVVLDQGFGVALIQRENLAPRDIGSVAWLNLATGTVLTVATLILAPYIADFFDTPELTLLLRVLSVTLFLRGLTLVREALIRRHLRFRQFALVQTAAVLAGGVAGVVAALLGADYWSLVVQTIVNDLVILVSLYVMFRSLSWKASWTSLRSMAGFSSKMLVANLLTYVGQNADNILIGRVLDPVQLAFYALSYRLLRLPIQMIGSVVNGVAMPIFSRLQDDDERSSSWLLVATRTVALVTFPLFGIMLIGAEAGVAVAFGEDWLGAVAPLQAMACAGLPMIVRMLLGPLATARGRAGLVLTWTLTTVGLQFVGFFVGLHLGGMVGVAISLAVVQYLTWLPSAYHILRSTLRLRFRTYLATLLPPFLGTLLAVAVWWGAYRPLSPTGSAEHDPLAAVGVTVLALGVYALTIRLVWPKTFRSAVEIVGEMRARRR